MKEPAQFVLDCSVTMSWAFGDEATDLSKNILKGLKKAGAIVPSLWSIETVNVLLVAERAKRLLPGQIFNFLEFLKKLPIALDESMPDHAFSSIFELAREYKLSAYDAAYLELASRKNLPIATFDKALRRAAKDINVAIYE